MGNTELLRSKIKDLIVRELMLKIGATEIGDNQPLFGPGGLGLDSVDALQLVVALEKEYGVKIPDPNAARQVLSSVASIAAAVAAAPRTQIDPKTPTKDPSLESAPANREP